MNRRVGIGVAAAGVLSAAPLASAAFQGAALVIQASNAQGTGQVVIPIEHGLIGNQGETYSYSLPASMMITDQSGAHVATLVNFTEFLVADPQVHLSFAVQAGVSDTVFTISTALLSFPTINNPIGTASGSLTVTDTDGNGATVSGIDAVPIYQWDYNGFVPGGSDFAALLTSVSAGAFQSNSASANVGPAGIAGDVSDMSGRVHFTLTANDLASGTGSFVIEIPTPGSLGLASLAALVAVPRRRR